MVGWQCWTKYNVTQGQDGVAQNQDGTGWGTQIKRGQDWPTQIQKEQKGAHKSKMGRRVQQKSTKGRMGNTTQSGQNKVTEIKTGHKSREGRMG